MPLISRSGLRFIKDLWQVGDPLTKMGMPMIINDFFPLLIQRLLQSAGAVSALSSREEGNEFAQVLQGWLASSLSTLPSVSGQSVGFQSLVPWSTLLEMVIRQNMSRGVEEEAPAFTDGGVPWSTARPVQGRLTQDFHPGHRGIDIGVPVGTPVRTTLSGQVVYAGWNTQGYGNLVIVENGPWRTYYAHLSEIPVQVGQWVQAGDVIGLSGNTGNSTGPHLHYEVRRNGVPVHPDELHVLQS